MQSLHVQQHVLTSSTPDNVIFLTNRSCAGSTHTVLAYLFEAGVVDSPGLCLIGLAIAEAGLDQHMLPNPVRPLDARWDAAAKAVVGLVRSLAASQG